jgi:Phosphatidylinositol-4-phosphate 5-Kinase
MCYSAHQVSKDLDLVRSGNKLHLGRQRDNFLKVIENDVNFLAKMRIMDYRSA